MRGSRECLAVDVLASADSPAQVAQGREAQGSQLGQNLQTSRPCEAQQSSSQAPRDMVRRISCNTDPLRLQDKHKL